MMRTGSVERHAAATVGVGPGAPPARTAALLVMVLMGALAVAGAAGGEPGPALPAAGPAAAGAAQQPAAVGLGRSVPLRVRVPAIGVDARIVPLGLVDGEVPAVPAAPLVGWYRRGTSPGEPGSAVLLGELDPAGPGGDAGAFAGLDRLAPGDRIEVARLDGATARFTVDSVRPYRAARAEPPAAGAPGVRLVGTTGVGGAAGVGREDAAAYRGVVVFASLVR